MSRRQVYFVKAKFAEKAACDVGIETIGTMWPNQMRRLCMVQKTAVSHQNGRFKVVCTYKNMNGQLDAVQ